MPEDGWMLVPCLPRLAVMKDPAGRSVNGTLPCVPGMHEIKHSHWIHPEIEEEWITLADEPTPPSEFDLLRDKRHAFPRTGRRGPLT